MVGLSFTMTRVVQRRMLENSLLPIATDFNNYLIGGQGGNVSQGPKHTDPLKYRGIKIHMNKNTLTSLEQRRQQLSTLLNTRNTTSSYIPPTLSAIVGAKASAGRSQFLCPVSVS